MAGQVLSGTGTGTVSVFPRFDEQLRGALAEAGRGRCTGGEFEPAFELPDTTPELVEFFSVADLRFAELGGYRDSRLVLLDLMGNPGTRTVKTLASHVIVARAARHVIETGEPIMIVTPSSANKATALRDAVLRAIQVGLVTSDQLRIVTLVPDYARPKLWSSTLDIARNPACVLDPAQPVHVKELARQAVAECAAEVFERTGIRLWHTLDLANYRCADAVRAYAERTGLPHRPGLTRAHAHSVSSAFGLLGHHFGGTLLPDGPSGQYFLVQHLATSDMVDSLHGIGRPEYTVDSATGLYHQHTEPRYPATTFDPAEVLETTFYTKNPATSPAMNEIIANQGGGGIVVSLHECLARYGETRALLGTAGIRVPSDPRELREWSLVMAVTGVLNGIDRGLLDADEVVVHGSGSYTTADYTPIPDWQLRQVTGIADLRGVIRAAATVRDR